METLKPTKVITTISNLQTKEVYKTEEEWKAKGIPEKDIRRDVRVIMPPLDLRFDIVVITLVGFNVCISLSSPY